MASLRMEILLAAVDRVTAPLRGMQSQIQRTAQALRDQQAALRALGTVPNRAALTQAQREQQRQIEQTTQSIARQRAELARLNQIQGSINRIDNFRTGLRNKGAMAVGAGTAGAYVGGKVVGAFTENESAETDLKTSMMRADGSVPAEYEKIVALANKLGDKLPGTTADFLQQMKALNNQGITFKSILGGTGEATAYMAVNMKMGFEEAAIFTAKVADATGTAEKDMMSLMDTIQKGMGLGLAAQEILDGIGKISPTQSILGKKGLEGADALMPFLVQAGQVTNEVGAAGNAFRKIFSRSLDQKRAGDANDIMKKHKMKLDFTDGKGEFKSIDNLYKQIAKLKKLNSVERGAVIKELYGDDAEVMMMINMMMEKGKAGYDEAVDKMKAQASLQMRVNAQLGTLANLWDAASGTFTNLMAHWGSLLAPELKDLVTWLTDATERLVNWSKSNPKLSKTIAIVAASIVTLTIAGGGLAISLWALTAPLTTLMGIFGVTAGAILLPVAAFVLLGAAIYMIYRQWDAFVWFFTSGISTLDNDLSQWLGSIPGVGPLLKGVYDIISWVFTNTTKGISEIIDLFTNWENTVNGVKFLWEEFKITIGGFWNDLKAKASAAIDYVMGKMQPLIDAIKKVSNFTAVGNWSTGGDAGEAIKKAEASAEAAKKRMQDQKRLSAETPIINPQNGQTVNSTNNITINATTNATASDIAKTVNTELDKRNRLPSRVNNGALIGDPK